MTHASHTSPLAVSPEFVHGIRLVLIDGRSGSGKTTLARDIARQLTAAAEVPAQLLHMDELYPGWDGLACGSRALAEVLSSGSYTPYDWPRAAFADAPVALDPARPLIVEGCGAITAANLAAAARWVGTRERVLAIYLVCDEDQRKRRALARDGDSFTPYWKMWAEQELAQEREHRPRELADLVQNTGGERGRLAEC